MGWDGGDELSIETSACTCAPEMTLELSPLIFPLLFQVSITHPLRSPTESLLDRIIEEDPYSVQKTQQEKRTTQNTREFYKLSKTKLLL